VSEFDATALYLDFLQLSEFVAVAQRASATRSNLLSGSRPPGPDALGENSPLS
jgi:hypothetical protein